MRIKRLFGIIVALAAASNAYTLHPGSMAVQPIWSYLNRVTISHPQNSTDATINYAAIGFSEADLTDIHESFRQYSAIFSASPNMYGRILFRHSQSDPQPQIIVANASIYNNGNNGSGCTITNNINYCTVYIRAGIMARHWIGRSLGIGSSGPSGGHVLSTNYGTKKPFTDADLTKISSTYSFLDLDLTGSPKTTPIFLAPYSNADHGKEIIVGWQALRNRIAPGRNPNVTLDYRTIAALPYSQPTNHSVSGMTTPDGPDSREIFTLEQYQQGSIYMSTFTWWPYLDKDYSWATPYAVTGNDPYPQLGLSNCSQASPYQQHFTFDRAPGLFTVSPALGGLFGTQGGLLFFDENRIPDQYAVPVYFFKETTSQTYQVSTSLPSESCYRLGGYAFSVE